MPEGPPVWNDGGVDRTGSRSGIAPLLAVSGVTILVIVGLAQGLWVANLHNGVLAVAFTAVGAHVLHERPRHRVGQVFVATGVVEAMMFLGRQIGHVHEPGVSSWWGWLGVWPLAVCLGLVTLSVLIFPDGQLPSPRWRGPVIVGAVLLSVVAVLSALWPAGYEEAGVTAAHPLDLPGADVADDLWSALARPLFVVLQLSWVGAVVVRWRAAGPIVRRQLALVGVAAAGSLVALAVGLIGWGSPTPGLLVAVLVPVAAGSAIVQGRHLAHYAALAWLSRSTTPVDDLPGDLAAATAEALSAHRSIVWMRQGAHLHAVGVWPETGETIAPVAASELLAGVERQGRWVLNAGKVTGAISVERDDPISRSEGKLLDDLAAQASLVLQHLHLAAAVARRPPRSGLGLTSRESEVLELMARGLTNAAICDELNLSVKTVEPVVGSIFTKLGLHPDTRSNRRVLAVVAFLS